MTLDFRPKSIDLMVSFQEIHLWNKAGDFSSVANVNFFELYVQFKLGNFFARAGRQRLFLDNGRIFSDAPWSNKVGLMKVSGFLYYARVKPIPMPLGWVGSSLQVHWILEV